PLRDDQPTLFMGALAVAPSNASILYAGTGEANHAGDSFAGVGILKSSDGGATWSLLQGNNGKNEFNRKSIAKIVISPTNPSVVYAAVTNAGANGLGGYTGIWKSTDGGTTWTDTTLPAPSTTTATSVLGTRPAHFD